MAPTSRTSTTRRKAATKKSTSRANKAGARDKQASTRSKSNRPKRATKQPAPAEIDDDALEFIAALDDYKKRHERPFPSWSEVLQVLKSLGYSRD